MGNRFQRSAALAFWLLVSGLYFSLIGQWISFKMADQEMAQYLERMIHLAATEQRSAKEVRQLMLVRAEQLSLPLHGGDLSVTGKGNKLRAVLHYETQVSIPILDQPVYRMAFQHDIHSDASQ